MASELFTKGVVEDSDLGRVAVFDKEMLGCVLWGPYLRLDPGSWKVRFEIEPSDYESIGDIACDVDVAKDDGRTILAEASVKVSDLLENKGEIDLNFQLNQTGIVEYRLFSSGRVKLRVRYFRRTFPFLAEGDLASIDPLREMQIYRDNVDFFSRLERGGVDFSLEQDKLIASTGDIKIVVTNAEDLQLLDEIFLINDYTICSPKPCMAIDIGMNVGVASLALAANPQVRRVVSFEPFSAPYERAQRNFALNPALAAKITPNNVGLSGQDEKRDVVCNPDSTIGVSVNGSELGQIETITLRDAASALSAHIAAATAEGLGVILKVDCEGSEFAVFESLENKDLLRSIDAVFIEWHKWWSEHLTQADLIRPLIRAGFFVFDRTSPDNPDAGFLLGVRGRT